MSLVLLVACHGPSTWLPRYDDAISELTERYAFTEHKELDWEAIDSAIRPQIAAAAQSEDKQALDDALRALVGAIPDNHVELSAAECASTEAGFGVVLSDSDEGVVVARVLDATYDVRPGEVVVSWNGAPIAEARTGAPTGCLDEGIATVERLAFEQLRFLARGADGETAVLVTEGGEHTLVAQDFDDEGFEAFETVSSCSNSVCGRIEGSIGIVSLTDTDGSVGRMQGFIEDFIDAGVEGVVLDLRGNTGGSDDKAASMAGFFNAESTFYEFEAIRDDSGTFVIDERYDIEPQDAIWTGATVVLVDGFTVSSGEGLAMAASLREDSVVVGFEGTAASFGFTGPSVSIGGRKIAYPDAVSWDVDEHIQLDSDASRTGGVQPDHRIPWTVENRRDQATGVDVVLRQALALLPPR